MDVGVVLQTNPPASRVVDLAGQAERLGFSHVWTFDSHLLWEEPFVIYSQILAETRKVAECVRIGQYAEAMAIRGRGFGSALRTLRTIVRALPHPPAEGQRRFRFAIMHGGGPAPGMNTAVRAALRLLLDRGHHVLGVRNAVRGLDEGDFFEMGWMSVNGWASRGGAGLGTNRRQPADRELYQVARHVEKHEIDLAIVAKLQCIAAIAGRQHLEVLGHQPGFEQADIGLDVVDY